MYYCPSLFWMFGMSIALNALRGIEKPKERKNGVCKNWETKENNNLQELKSQKKIKKKLCSTEREKEKDLFFFFFGWMRKGERLDNII